VKINKRKTFPSAPRKPKGLARKSAEPKPPDIFQKKFRALLPAAKDALGLNMTWPTPLAVANVALQTQVFSRLRPETDLEKRICAHPDFLACVVWGPKRPGHHEGTVMEHIALLFNEIEQWTNNPAARALPFRPAPRRVLRPIGLIHDAFKRYQYEKPKALPQASHFQFAASFARHLGVSENICRVIELHDFSFYIMRDFKKTGDEATAKERTRQLLACVDPKIYFAFIYVDRRAGLEPDGSPGNTDGIIAFWNQVQAWGLLNG